MRYFAKDAKSLSLLHGRTEQPLLSASLGSLLEQQTIKFGTRDAVVSPETGARLTYHDLNERTKLVAKGLVAHGIRAGDHIGIFSGNCERYMELFLAAGRIGAIAVVLNNTYTAA
jgi:mevalonyl-CoA ligase